MPDKQEYRGIVYENYLNRPQSAEARGFVPHQIPDAYGDALFGDAFSGLGPDASILELGSGAGHFMEYLKRKGFQRVRGVDLCEPLVESARQSGLDVTHGNAIQHLAGLPDASLDAIVTIDMIEHLTKNEIISLFSHSVRTLRPGGVIIIQTVNGQGLFPGQIIYGDETHVTVLNPMSLAHLLMMVGFDEPEFRESTYFGPGKKAFFRKFAWKACKSVANFCRWVEAGKRQDLWSENMICYARRKRQ